MRVHTFLPRTVGVVLATGLLLATAAPAKVPAVQRAKPGDWIACFELYKEESEARKAAARCAPQMSCEEYARRNLAQPRIWRTPEMPVGYRGPYGLVRLRIFFDENGKFFAADVLASPDDRLSQAAIATARTMEIHPWCHEGKRVPVAREHPFQFINPLTGR